MFKWLKKPPRKSDQSSNQKTKPLSSIDFDRKSGNRKGGCDTSYYADKVIKLLDSGPAAVACIPVKLVFSRLLEAVGRLPSGLGKHRSSYEQPQKDRNPSRYSVNYGMGINNSTPFSRRYLALPFSVIMPTTAPVVHH